MILLYVYVKDVLDSVVIVKLRLIGLLFSVMVEVVFVIWVFFWMSVNDFFLLYVMMICLLFVVEIFFFLSFLMLVGNWSGVFIVNELDGLVFVVMFIWESVIFFFLLKEFLLNGLLNLKFLNLIFIIIFWFVFMILMSDGFMFFLLKVIFCVGSILLCW